MDMIERIRAIAKEKSKSMASFSAAIGIPQPTLNNQMLGQRKISLETIYAILDTFPDVSAEWLLRGEGEMGKGEVSLEQSPLLEKSSGDESLFFKKIIDEQLDTIKMLRAKVREYEEKATAEKERQIGA
jgi:transcriptional regulator with XRE-family HTH domain